jgi:hypothetical protein
MSAGYLQGRLTLGKFASATGGPEIQYVNGSAAQQVFSCVPMECSDHLENARRLVACWNACERIDIEYLEDIATVGGFEGLAVDLIDTSNERDKLRADLDAAHKLLSETLIADDLALAGMRAMGMAPDADVTDLTERVRAMVKGGAK